MKHSTQPQNRTLRIAGVLNKIGISRTQLYRLIKQGDFPRQFHLGVRTSVWSEADIDAWILSKQQGA